ncbi:hypothetical protein [Streptomyces sp. AD55]|uniref:hypothetical protein n=1 Tax=Streptomyces sp. AD55 TaxID=3242895 RepID=UPI00352737F4
MTSHHALALAVYDDDEARGLRDLAVAHWLLSTVRDQHQAVEDWRRTDTALFPCGQLFSAVRIPAALVWAAVGAEDPEAVDPALRGFFPRGAVAMDQRSHMYYALVPPGTEWPAPTRRDPTECLDASYYLGLPPIPRRDPGGRCYWCVPMEAPGALCDAGRVAELVRLGREATAPGEDQA